MQKPAKLLIASVVLCAAVAGGYAFFTRDTSPQEPPLPATETPIKVGDTIRFRKPTTQREVTLRNPNGKWEWRHGDCGYTDQRDDRTIQGGDLYSWDFGDTCDIGHEGESFTLTVIGFIDDSVLLQYDRDRHLHTGWFKREIECPTRTVFLETRDWTRRWMAAQTADAERLDKFQQAIDTFRKAEEQKEEERRWNERHGIKDR